MKVSTGRLLGLVVGGLVGLAYVLAPRPKHPASTPIPWESNLPAAMSKAGTEQKLVMVDFYTTWCRWCQRLDQTTLSEQQVVTKVSGEFVPVRLDAEKEGRELAHKLGVDGYPTVVFLDAAGQEVYRITGYLEPKDFLEELEKVKRRT